MTTLVRPLIAAILTLTAGAAHADDGGFYLKAYGGLSTLGDTDLNVGGTTTPLSFDNGVLAGGAFGYDYGSSPWRAELEFTYRSGDSDPVEGDFASTSVMLNGFYSFGTGGRVTPYVGAGIGLVTEIDFDIDSGPLAGEYADRDLFAAQVMVGADIALSTRWSLFGELRYFAVETPDLHSATGNAVDADYRTIDALVGLVFTF